MEEVILEGKTSTEDEFRSVMKVCSELFYKKLEDYGVSWKAYRPTTLTDQLLIKALRIKSIEETGVNLVDEPVFGEFIALVNYGITGQILLKGIKLDVETVRKLYEMICSECLDLMLKKNHDYGEAWREMRISSYTDLIITKIYRVKQIEDNQGKVSVSEGIVANYQDIVNYSIFALIRLGIEI